MQAAVDQVALIVEGYRTLYTTHGVDTGDWTDITCLGVNNNFFPRTMLPAGACASGNGGTYPQHPWNNFAQVFSYQDWQGIIVRLFGLTQDACSRYANQVMNAADIIWENVNGTSRTLPPIGAQTPLSSTDINTACVAGNGNLVDVMFKAR